MRATGSITITNDSDTFVRVWIGVTGWAIDYQDIAPGEKITRRMFDDVALRARVEVAPGDHLPSGHSRPIPSERI